jgi:ribosomal protein S18 acetylase RimI-like enzyme
MLRKATLANLTTVASWVSSQRDCDLWTGGRLTYPIDMATLPTSINFSEQHAYVWTASSNDSNDGSERPERESRTPVGFGQVIVKPTGRVHLATIIVDPAQRGYGYGKQLVQALLAQARAQGSRISLNVDAQNAAAVALYSSLGFGDATRPADQAEFPGVRYMEATGRRA